MAGSMTTATSTTRCLIYTRVSKRRPGETQRSPEEQLADLKPVARANGWRVAKVLTDAIGATRHTRKERAGWPDVLAAIRAGSVDVLLVWEVSRLTRNEREYADFADLCESTGTKVAVSGHVYDLAEPMDRLILGQLVNFAAFEAAMTRKRSMRGQSANLATGKPAGRVLFGYHRKRDPQSGALLGQEVDPVTGPLVRELFSRVANGESVRSVQLDWTRRGVAPQGGRLAPGEVRPWARTTLNNMLRNRSYLGHRTHGGKVAIEAAWPALIDPATFERVQAVIGDPARRKSQDVRVKHLLAGLLRCEVCEGRVTYKQQRCRGDIVHGPGGEWRGECRDCEWRGRRRRTQEGAERWADAHRAELAHLVDVVEVMLVPVATYTCKEGGHVNAAAERLEAGVRELLVSWLSEPDALDVWVVDDVDTAGLVAELKTLTARLDDVANAVKVGEMSARMAGGIERDLEPRIDELREILAGASSEVPAPVAAMAGENAAEWWDDPDTDIEAKRAVIRATLRDAELRRSPNRTHRDDLGLRFKWAGKRVYEV